MNKFFYLSLVMVICALCFISCSKDGTPQITEASSVNNANPNLNNPSPVNPTPNTLFRIMTGDNTTINPDWTATENGYHFDIAENGTPSAPTISPIHLYGNYSIKIQVPTDLSGNAERFEYKIAKATDSDGLHFDNYRYCGFAFMLDSASAPFLNSTIFWQAWQGNPWGPPCMLKFAKGSTAPYVIRLTIRNMTTGPDSSVPDIELWSDTVIYPGRWYNVEVYLKPDFTGNGNVKLWINSTLKLDWSGAIGYDTSAVSGAYNGLDVKNGIYQPDANNGHTIYFDNIKFADTYADGVTGIIDRK
jgi:hypothetical protein